MAPPPLLNPACRPPIHSLKEREALQSMRVGQGHDGTLHNEVTWTNDGKSGHALRFDGQRGYVELGNSSDLHLYFPYTIEAWVTFYALDQHHRFLNKGDTTSGMWSLYRDHNDGKIALQMCSNGQWHRALVGTTSPQAQQWYHVVVTSDGNIAKLYINGQQEASSSHVLGSQASRQ